MRPGHADPARENPRDRGAAAAATDAPRDPFKQIACANIKRLCLLPPPALKVWLYHLSLSGPADVSFAKLDTIAAATGLHASTVKSARNWLSVNGWFEDAGHRSFGRVSLPVLRCVFPGPRAENAPSVGASRVQKAPSVGSRRLKNAPSVAAPKVQIAPTEVDLNLEVDGRTEVHAAPRPQQLVFGELKTPVLSIEAKQTDRAVPDAAAIWTGILASLRRRVNPHSFGTWFLPVRAESLRGDRLTVSIPRHCWVKRLRETYGAVLAEALSEINRPELMLEFTEPKGVEARAP